MRYTLTTMLLAMSPCAALGQSCEIRWPDVSIPVPPLVQTYIASECVDFAGTTDEDVDTCIAGERMGYRATVAMLSDAASGERAAALYRACRAGLGAENGRFHRRRAECMGGSFRIVWRFEHTRRASLGLHDVPIQTAERTDGSRTEAN